MTKQCSDVQLSAHLSKRTPSCPISTKRREHVEIDGYLRRTPHHQQALSISLYRQRSLHTVSGKESGLYILGRAVDQQPDQQPFLVCKGCSLGQTRTEARRCGLFCLLVSCERLVDRMNGVGRAFSLCQSDSTAPTIFSCDTFM